MRNLTYLTTAFLLLATSVNNFKRKEKMNTKTQKTKQTQKATKQQEYLKAINYIQALTPQQLSKIKGGQYLLPPN